MQCVRRPLLHSHTAEGLATGQTTSTQRKAVTANNNDSDEIGIRSSAIHTPTVDGRARPTTPGATCADFSRSQLPWICDSLGQRMEPAATMLLHTDSLDTHTRPPLRCTSGHAKTCDALAVALAIATAARRCIGFQGSPPAKCRRISAATGNGLRQSVYRSHVAGCRAGGFSATLDQDPHSPGSGSRLGAGATATRPSDPLYW
jgi:hypothetical protein